jgi:hypothetical protein
MVHAVKAESKCALQAESRQKALNAIAVFPNGCGRLVRLSRECGRVKFGGQHCGTGLRVRKYSGCTLHCFCLLAGLVLSRSMPNTRTGLDVFKCHLGTA